jgi:uncharacterized protein DUF6348
MLAPELLPSNPGKTVSGNVGFSNAERSWSEHFNVVTLFASALRNLGHDVQVEESWIVHRNSGFILLPRFVELQPLQKGGARTVTTVQTNHPALVPSGVFEYQHATGDNVEDSIHEGFDQWAQNDFVALLDSLQRQPATCTILKMDFPETDGKPAFTRRAVLGPVACVVENPQIPEPKKSGGEPAGEQRREHDQFCPCCLLTNSWSAFRELIEGREFYGVRLFAARDETGAPRADCRVNGNDWEKGAEALRKYVETWPHQGFQFRKQYVVLQTSHKES